nr:retrovirus-related Pol polyprotein from transposon TNT 1-94 [Tanacetum cinerariifolium]
MTGVKQYLHRYSKESGPKVVFGDNSSGDTEGYSSVNCNGITFTKVAYVNGLKHNLISICQLCDANFKVLFTKTQESIFNEKDKVVFIAPRRRDVYVIEMSSYNTDSNACFYAKASPSDDFEVVKDLKVKEEHPRCYQAKDSKVEERLVHLMMVVNFEVLIDKKKMCSLGLMRFDLWMEFLMVHLEELEMKKLLWEKVVTSSSLEMLTNSCLGVIMVSLIFLEGLEEEALVEFMVK